MLRSLRTIATHPAIVGMQIGAISFGGLIGCSTIKFAQYPDVAVNQLERVETHSGVSIGIDPLMTRDEAMEHFKVDLTKNKIIAVYVKMMNNSNSSVLLANNQFSLVGFERGDEDEVLRSGSGGSGVALVGAALLSLPLLFIGMKMVSDADNIKKNFAVKELQRQGVSPGQSVAGFVYFQQPEDAEKKIDSWLIRVTPTNFRGEPIGVFEYIINSEKE